MMCMVATGHPDNIDNAQNKQMDDTDIRDEELRRAYKRAALLQRSRAHTCVHGIIMCESLVGSSGYMCNTIFRAYELLTVERAMATNSVELEELNAKTNGIGAWVLKIHGMRWIEYAVTRQRHVQKERKSACSLTAQSGTYCHDVIKAQYSRSEDGGGVNLAAELKTMMNKFKDGSIFRLNRITLTEENAKFIGAPLNMYIDLRKTKCATISPGLVDKPPAPAPIE